MSLHDVPRRLPRLLALAAVLALCAAACSNGSAARTAEASPSAAASASPAPSAAADPSTGTMHLVPPTAVPGTVGARQDVIDAAVADAATLAGVPATDVTVVSSRVTDWPNAALGCPQRGVMYIEVITPGYQVVVEAGGKQYDYRASAKTGVVRLCENPGVTVR